MKPMQILLALLAVVMLLAASHGVIRARHHAVLRDLRARALSVKPPAYLTHSFVDRLIAAHRATFGNAVMALWTDIIDPATLTDYARAAQEDYEQKRGNLARWLPNRTIADIVVRFIKGNTGLQEAARFRAFDAEIEIGPRPSGQRVTLELPALGQNLPVSEYEQLRARGGSVSDEQALATIQSTTERVVAAVSDAMERLRGIVLATGRATIDQSNFEVDDSFGRSGTHTVTSPTLWTNTAFDRLTYLQGLRDVYIDDTGEEPGALVMSTRAYRALASGDNLRTNLVGGATRLPNETELESYISAAGLPPIIRYDRRVRYNRTNVRALPDNVVLMLPAPVDPNDEMGTDLGATFWGRTLASTESEWGIPDEQQPGIVAGVWRDDKPPMGIEVIGDAIGEPVLANADLSIAATVL
jgi:hypothetical protein